MPWVRRRYRKNKVWVLVDEQDQPIVDDRGLASLRYKPEDERTYTIRCSEVAPIGPEPPDDTVRAWIAVQAEPPRVGALLDWRGRQREIATDLADTPGGGDVWTCAVLAVLGEIRRKKLPLHVHVPDPAEMERRARTGPGYEPALAAAVARFGDLTFLDTGEDGEAWARAESLASTS